MQTQTATIGNIARNRTWRFDTAPTPALPAHGPDLRAIDGFGTVILVGRDQEVYAEGDPAEYCYKVVAGAIRTVKLMADGRRQVAEFYLPHDFFGFDACGTRYMGAEAVADATLVRYPLRRIEAQAEHDCGFARDLRDLTSGSLRKAHEQMLLLGRKSARERIASFLLDMSDRAPAGPDHGAIELPMSRVDIADHLGLTLETVSRVLNRLHRDEVINLASTHRIEIADREGLEEIGGEA